MNRSLSLEDFASPEAPASRAPTAPEVTDQVEALDAYESGYKSGWADCAAAEDELRKSVGTDLAKRLREAELTYSTARQDILSSLAPFFEELVTALLPRLASDAVAPMAAQELHDLLQHDASAAIQVMAAPASCETVQRLLEAEGFEDVSVRAEPAFSETQVSLRVGSERRDIDLSDITLKITEAVRAFQAQADDPVAIKGAA
jgi:flagellar assembly protein FliH